MGKFDQQAGERASPSRRTGLGQAVSRQIVHADKVFATIAKPDPSVDDFVRRSWLRSLELKIDPASDAFPTILTNAELLDARGPLERLASASSDELDRLFAAVRHSSYTVLLCSNTGIVVDHRGERDDADRYRFWGSWLGAIWSEDLEGTNGVGTCIVEKRPITIHRAHHFRGRHTGLSCSSAPIFDQEDRLIAVLDVASIDPNLSEGSHSLAGALVAATARSIEERLFRETFRACWIVAMAPWNAKATGMLFAVDRDLRVVGAGRTARSFIQSSGIDLGAPTDVWSFFKKDHNLFRIDSAADRAVRVVPLEGDDELPALITPPERAASWHNLQAAVEHTRPRLELLTRFRPQDSESRRKGGLSSLSLKRVRSHIDAKIEDNIDLNSLAAAAGLSVHHFARAFKESEGITPHAFVMMRRIERAKLLLGDTEQSLAEVAVSCGFADQSHFARSFRRATGVTPGAFRVSRHT